MKSNFNLIAQYETADGPAEIHGLNGGFTVFVGERMVQKDLNSLEIVCYLAHVLQAAHYKLSKSPYVGERDNRHLHDGFTEIIAQSLHYAENVERVNNMRTATEVQQAIEGGIERYQKDAMFRAKVQAVVARLMQFISNCSAQEKP